MKLFLIGLMGSGKSFLGKKISEALHLPFIDLDSAIEKEEGSPVSKIFSERGEEYFRNVEAATLRKCSEETEFVMATGGGAPCFHQNMDFIKSAGISIFLNVPINVILNRLDDSQRDQRPILRSSSSDNLEQILSVLLTDRLKFYSRADFTLSGEVSESAILQVLSSRK